MKRLVIAAAVGVLAVAGVIALSQPSRSVPKLQVTLLTEDRARQDALVNEFPVASPDGSYLVFQRSEDVQLAKMKDGTRDYDFTDDSNWDIWRMNVDGTERVRLTDGPTLEDQPIPSPDGKTIVYRYWVNNSFDVYLMDADGNNKRPLVEEPSDEKAPAFSSDGRRVIFFSNRDGVKWNLYSIELATRKITRLTKDKYEDKHPQFSRDDRTVIFHSDRNERGRTFKGGNHNMMGIYALDLATSKISRLTPPPNDEEDFRHPFVSPDGRFITFHRNLLSPKRGETDVAKRTRRDIFVMSVDGKKLLNLTEGDDRQFKHPSWSADGKKIFCLMKEGENAWNICALEAAPALAQLQ